MADPVAAAWPSSKTAYGMRDSRIETGMKNDVSHQTANVLALGDFDPAAELLKSLGHPQRLMIVCALMNGERAVSELERELAIRQPSLSQHLGVLRDAGVIVSRRNAKSVIYTISDARIVSIIDALRSAFAAPMKSTGRAQKALLAPIIGMPTPKRSSAELRAPGEAAFFARVGPKEFA